jgi:lipid-A-disaccharide synthase
LVFVASGSATLEVAAAGCPMIVMYQSNKLLWHLLGKFLIKTRYLSLVNILAGSQLVPELMPYLPSDDVILRQAMRLIQSPALLKDTSTKLTHLTYPLALLDAPQETANLILQQLEQSPRI